MRSLTFYDMESSSEHIVITLPLVNILIVLILSIISVADMLIEGGNVCGIVMPDFREF